MEKIILGILMLKKLTVYEIRAVIRANFQAMCSDSLGSIQSALKRLLEAELVTFREYVEKSVNKKRFSITDKGREELLHWLKTPANISNAKNMELGKILFMGMLAADERLPLLDEIIANLEQDLADMLAIQSAVASTDNAELSQHWQTDPQYYEFVSHKSKEIEAYQMLTLQYGIDIATFNVEWFQKLKRDSLSEKQI